MRICQYCGTSLKDNAKYCYKCGRQADLAKSCLQCGTELKENANFCPKCAAPVFPAKAQERQTVDATIKNGPLPPPEASAKKRKPWGVISAGTLILLAGAFFLLFPKLLEKPTDGHGPADLGTDSFASATNAPEQSNTIAPTIMATPENKMTATMVADNPNWWFENGGFFKNEANGALVEININTSVYSSGLVGYSLSYNYVGEEDYDFRPDEYQFDEAAQTLTYNLRGWSNGESGTLIYHIASDHIKIANVAYAMNASWLIPGIYVRISEEEVGSAKAINAEAHRMEYQDQTHNPVLAEYINKVDNGMWFVNKASGYIAYMGNVSDGFGSVFVNGKEVLQFDIYKLAHNGVGAVIDYTRPGWESEGTIRYYYKTNLLVLSGIWEGKDFSGTYEFVPDEPPMPEGNTWGDYSSTWLEDDYY